jgi:type I restriction-modification system DNA methylase subunit
VHEYGDVILPFVALRRLDLVLEPKKDEAMFKEFFYGLNAPFKY